MRSGYKQTEVGIIPEDWNVRTLGSLFSLKSGFSFKSEYFSSTGPIVLTPGNFRLDGGLYFNERNTKRYSEPFPSSMAFEKGDLLVVMTDLTPECNLLGKPAFVETNELVLHNQRIGKVQQLSGDIDKEFLYVTLLSDVYLRKIKEQATGSTVRHTSNKSIYSISVPLPSNVDEQKAIAKAIKGADDLLASLDRLIAKKRAVKLATMQQLLTGEKRLAEWNDRWELRSLGDVCEIVNGGTPSTTNPAYWGGSIPWCTPTDITSANGKYLTKTARKITQAGLNNSSANLLPSGTLLLCTRATIGEVNIATSPVATNQGFKSLICRPGANNEFIYYLLLTLKPKLIERGSGSTFLEISKKDIASLEVHLPLEAEQHAIATILSDMDAEISALQARRDKTAAIKQGMMQQLLTGETRLV